jgi:hypothetical protein
MVEVNKDEDATANESCGDEAGGNLDQPPMDLVEDGRLSPPVDAADYQAQSGDNPFADDRAQKAVGKPTGVAGEKDAKAKGDTPAADDRAPDAAKNIDDKPKQPTGLTTKNTPTRAPGGKR